MSAGNPNRRPPQFRLADILWLTLVVALLISWTNDWCQLASQKHKLLQENHSLRQTNADLRRRTENPNWMPYALLPYMEQQALFEDQWPQIKPMPSFYPSDRPSFRWSDSP